MKHKHHIIPKHAGGTDDPSNIIELTVEEHALAHKKLFEEEGRWQDYIAWQGLSGRIGKEEIIQFKNKMAHLGLPPWNKGLKGYNSGKHHYRYGKKISKEISQKISNTLKNNSCRAKKFIITNLLTTETTIIFNLKKYCKENNFHYQSFHRCFVRNRLYKKTYTITEY